MGFQQQKIFHDLIPDWASGLLGNGMVAGTLVAVLLTSLLQLKGGVATRLETTLEMRSLGALQALARKRAEALHWDESSAQRIELALEEALALLVEHAGNAGSPAPRLRLEVRAVLGALEVELIGLPLGVNLNDLPAAALRAETGPEDALLGLRVLEAMVEDLRHQQYHGIDFLSFRVVPREAVTRV
jgi:anti-sigma regulatory factor (Ser/Thr protein kinase)